VTIVTSIEARVDAIARASRGRLVAMLAVTSRDIGKAEDAVSDAFAAALVKWPAGFPRNPEAWLMTVARNRLRDAAKSAYARHSVPLDPEQEEPEAMSQDGQHEQFSEIPDQRLKLMFACAHPAIDPAIRAPLILQTVMGLEAADVARLFAIPAAAMSQRLVRAKVKIRDAGIPFRIPDRGEMAERLESVLEAIYAIYADSWEDVAAELSEDRSVEALYLADLTAHLLPDEPEALGLAALISYSAARRGAWLDNSGNYVPLNAQDPSAWDLRLTAHADNHLRLAQRRGEPGRFQLEAAIQCAHMARRNSGHTDWNSILMLYEGLMALAPSLGAAVARAAAVGEAHGAETGLRALFMIDAAARAAFQPALACEAHLLTKSGNYLGALSANRRAIDLCTSAPMRKFLEKERKRIEAQLQ
jgi:RNA polymerase sigma-70 factor, ECF subfamily